MARVLLINPVVREEDVPRHIPYGEALLAAIAQRDGHQVAVYDANAWRQPIEKVADACRADAWDVIAIGGLTTTYNCLKACFRIARETSPKSVIVAGGGFLTSMPLEVMDWLPEIDVGLVGECFRSWPELLQRVDEGERDFSDMTGIVYRDAAGPALTAARPVIHELDELPFPAWELFPLEEVYFKNSSSLFSEEAYLATRRIDVNASFGCSLICRYCWHLGTTGDMLVEQAPAPSSKLDVVFTYGRNIRYHSPSYIVGMVTELKKSYGVDFVNFLDENLMTMHASSGRKWLHQIADEWIRAGLQPVRGKTPQPGVFWSGTSHAGLYDQGVLEHMAAAGCTHLVYGLESFDPGILKRLGKGTTRDKNIRSVGDTLAAGIIPIPNIIIGFPEETYATLRNTITALLELGIHAKPHFATAYPGSEWYYAYKGHIAAQYGGDLEAYVKDLGDATKITGTISHHFTPAELLGLQEIVARRDLRLLDLTEARQPLRTAAVAPQPSFNFRAKKIDGPMEAQKARAVA